MPWNKDTCHDLTSLKTKHFEWQLVSFSVTTPFNIVGPELTSFISSARSNNSSASLHRPACTQGSLLREFLVHGSGQGIVIRWLEPEGSCRVFKEHHRLAHATNVR